MQLKLSPCTVEDSEEMVKVLFAAFADSHFLKASYRTPQDIEAAVAWNIQKTIKAFESDAPERAVKVVDEDTGKMVGFVKWTYPHNFTKEEKRRASLHDATPPMVNKELYEKFASETAAIRAKNVDPEKDFVLSPLVVLPTHRKRGIASILLTPLLTTADALNARICLESTPAGRALYKRHGFVDTGEVMQARLADFGYTGYGKGEEGVHRNWFMVRERVGVGVGEGR